MCCLIAAYVGEMTVEMENLQKITKPKLSDQQCNDPGFLQKRYDFVLVIRQRK